MGWGRAPSAWLSPGACSVYIPACSFENTSLSLISPNPAGLASRLFGEAGCYDVSESALAPSLPPPPSTSCLLQPRYLGDPSDPL